MPPKPKTKKPVRQRGGANAGAFQESAAPAGSEAPRSSVLLAGPSGPAAPYPYRVQGAAVPVQRNEVPALFPNIFGTLSQTTQAGGRAKPKAKAKAKPKRKA